MLKEAQGKSVTVYLNFSAWGDHVVRGEVIEFNDSWLKVKNKNKVELISLDSVKRISVQV